MSRPASTRAFRRVAPALSAVLGGVPVLVLAAGLVPLPGAPVAAATDHRLGLVAETFNVGAEGVLDLTVEVPDDVAAPTPDASIVLTAYQPVNSRDDVERAIAGDLPGIIDHVDLTADLLDAPADRQLRATVPVEVTRRTPDAIQLSRPGVYPLTVTLVEQGEPVAEVVTFVHRVPSATEGEELAMPVAAAVAGDLGVTMSDDGEVQVSDADLRQLTALADLLDASKVPLAVRIPPGVLAGLADSGAEGAELAARLTSAFERHALLSAPVLPLDPSAAAAAGQQGLYTQWLRDGEDSLASSVDAPAVRTAVLVDHPLSQAGGALLRNLGARLLVLPTDLYDQLPNTLGGFTDTTQLVQIRVAPGVTVDAAVVDRTASRAMQRVTTTPVLSAIETVADLLALRQQIDDWGGDPRRHSVTLATPDLGPPDPSGFAAFTTLLAATPGLRPTTLDDISVRTDQLLGPEGPIVVDLPPTVPGTVAGRTNLAKDLGVEATSAGSMLSDGDPRAAEWGRLISVLPTSALTDTQATTIGDRLRAEFAALRAAVTVPTGFSFNLTGRTGTVPVNLRNDADIPLTVRIRMSSPKLLFPDGDLTVTLAPQSFTQVNIAIEARSNGRFPAALEVFTPVGDTRIAPPVPLTASINALSGIGNLVTGAALLVLLTWWVRNFRRGRRNRRAADAADRHPAGRGDALDDSGLSPDAATSTLPPS